MHFDELQGSYGGHEGVALVLTPRVGEDRRKCLHAVRNAKDRSYLSERGCTDFARFHLFASSGGSADGSG